MINKQDYINAVNQNIEMVKGDTLAFNFQLQGLGGDNPDTIIFSCAEHYGDSPIFTANLNDGISNVDYDVANDLATYSVRIAPQKTASLDVNRYYYDMQLTVNDDVITLMRGRLALLNEVTR
jgi:hypothetical protein